MSDPTPQSQLDASPLQSVSIESIFAADPRTLTPADRAELVKELRRRRSAHLADEAAKLAKGKTKATKTPPVPTLVAAKLDKPNGELDLGDLLG